MEKKTLYLVYCLKKFEENSQPSLLFHKFILPVYSRDLAVTYALLLFSCIQFHGEMDTISSNLSMYELHIVIWVENVKSQDLPQASHYHFMARRERTFYKCVCYYRWIIFGRIWLYLLIFTLQSWASGICGTILLWDGRLTVLTCLSLTHRIVILKITYMYLFDFSSAHFTLQD